MRSKRITLLGASGYTGYLIAKKLSSLNIPYSIAGRNIDKLINIQNLIGVEMPLFVADITSLHHINSLLNNTDILINCVGPFNLFGKQIIDQCAERKIIYLDITGEQEFVRYSFEKLDLIAKKSEATIIHSISFESCLANLLAERIIEKEKKYKDISSYYHFKHARPSPGTRLTMKLAKFYPTYILRKSKLEKLQPLKYKKEVLFAGLSEFTKALFMPYPEVIFYSKKYKVENSGSFLLMTESDARIAENKPDLDNSSLESILKKQHKIIRSGPTEKERESQTFTLIVNAIQENNVQSNILIKGTDMYGITASLVVIAIEKLIDSANTKTGIVYPEDVDEKFLDKIIQDHKLEVHENI